MKNLILENENELDQQIEGLFKYQFKENQEIWLQFRFAFWAEERKETLKKFLSLETDDNIICHTVFDGMQQTELMVDVLYKLMQKGIKINFFIMSNLMIEELIDYIKRSKYVYEDEKEERQKILANMKEVILYHKIYNITMDAFYNRKQPHDIFKKYCIFITPEILSIQ